MEETKNEEPENKEPIKEKKKIIIETAIATLAILSVLALIFFIFQKYREGKLQIDDLTKQLEQQKNGNPQDNANIPGDEFSDPLSDNPGPSQNGNGEIQDPSFEIDVYAGWKTYINREVGYKLRYPENWEVKEVNEFSELTEQNVKYITLNSPQNAYSLYWGLKKNNDPFAISDRTGVGAGDFAKDGKITILNTSVEVNKQVFEGKIQEYFFPKPITAKSADGAYTFGAAFSNKARANIPNNSAEIGLAKKILESIKIIDRNKEQCISTLTANDKLLIKDWNTYYDDKYNYSFKYPKGFGKHLVMLIGNKKQEDVAAFGPQDRTESIEFRSANTAISFPPQWQLDRTKNIKVACTDAVSQYFSHEDRIGIITKFEKNGVKREIVYEFKNLGASISSDLMEMYDTYLRTVEFY